MSRIEVEIHDRAALVTLNAPPINILTAELQAELRTTLETLRRSNGHNVLILRSALAKAFSGGADVREHLGRENCRRMLEAASALIAELLRHPVPTVAAVHGACLGGAFELVLACDQWIATADATFGTPEITLGCYPPAALVLMPQKLPPPLASELIQSGRAMSATDLQARGAGLRVVEGFDAAVMGTAGAFARLPRGPLAEATRLLRSGASERFTAAIGGIDAAYLDRLLDIPDAREGPQAFLDKREPRWDHASGENP